MVQHARDLTGEVNLCLSGGVALNCVANGRVLIEGGFDRVRVQPSAGDAWQFDRRRSRPLARRSRQAARLSATTDAMSGSFLGPGVLPDEVDRWIESVGLTEHEIRRPRQLATVVARRLADDEIVGWFQGRMEFGPRSLGHRSIIADARSTTARHRLNSSVKRREDFRPFAPAVIEEHVE